MKKKATRSFNRTGTELAPNRSEQLEKFAHDQLPDIKQDLSLLEEARESFVREASELGSIPMPAPTKHANSHLKEKSVDTQLGTLIDKLGERLAYERNGVRLYEAMLAKVKALPVSQPDTIGLLEHFRNEEAEHFALLLKAMKSLGIDPTAQTPSADAAGVSGLGIAKVISDPRTTLAQCFNALLTVELTDNASWELLIKLAKHTKQKATMIEDFKHALNQEKDHLKKIKACLEKLVLETV